MLKTQYLTPEYYYKESRDFQFFGRLFDILSNYLKTEIDLIRSFPINNNQSALFTELLLRTLNFRPKRDYQLNQLQALSKSWVNIIKHKGSKQGIDLLIKCILRAENISNDYNIKIDDTGKIPHIYIQVRDLISSQESALLEECLNYILPINTLFTIQDINNLNEFTPMNIWVEENTTASKVSRVELGSLAKKKESYINETLLKRTHTGKFDQPVEHKLNIGSIKVGALRRKKSEE